MAYTSTCPQPGRIGIVFRSGVFNTMMRFKMAVCGGFLGSVLFAQQTPGPCPAEGFSGGFTKGCPQKQFAAPSDISAMMSAVPDKAPATPQSLRRVLVLAKATGFVHSSIPLASKMAEYLGDKTGAWMTTISYDSASITADNLKQYDAVFLDSTAGEFLDDPNDQAATK